MLVIFFIKLQQLTKLMFFFGLLRLLTFSPWFLKFLVIQSSPLTRDP